MSTLSQCILSVCFCAVAVGVIEMLLPSKVSKNQMRLITGCVLLISMLSPFVYGLSFSLPDFHYVGNTSVSESLENSIAVATKEKVVDTLEKYDCGYKKITVDVGKDKNGSIILDGLYIYFSEKDYALSKKAVSKIDEELGVKTNIGVQR